jgi:tetratricopeptide (TPR) repeat protein
MKKAINTSEKSHPPQSVLERLLKDYGLRKFKQVLKQTTLLTKQYPESFVLWNVTGACNLSLSRYQKAGISFQQAIALNPKHPDSYNNLGLVFQKTNSLEKSVKQFEKALELKPDFVEAIQNLGGVFHALGKFEDALALYQRASHIAPDNIEILNNLGVVRTSLSQFDLAEQVFMHVLEKNPRYFKAHNNLGVVKKDQGYLGEAQSYFEKALSLKPDFTDAYANLGSVLRMTGNLGRSIEAYRKALELGPHNADIKYKMSFALLQDLNFREGYRYAEARWKTKQHIGSELISRKPMWSGNLENTLLIWGEQGIGDQLMFCSLLPQVQGKVKRLIVQCDQRLLSLFKRSLDGEVEFRVERHQIKEIDYDSHIAMGSMPRFCRSDLDSFKPWSRGYLKPNEQEVLDFKKKLKRADKKLLIGVSWRTKSVAELAAFRNIELIDLLNYLPTGAASIVSLQYGDVSEQLAQIRAQTDVEVMQIYGLDTYRDIDGLASLVSACDVVVSIDNSTVHLAGSLGVDTRVLLPLSCDARWGATEEKSYWYDSVRLYRQTRLGHWSGALERLSADLENLVSGISQDSLDC